jgi:hypothetical protein
LALKIKFDECISNRVARAVMALTADREGYEVSYVRHGDGALDPNWITAFAEQDGTAIVSGDHDILQHWPNLVAYTESGLISFFPPKAFERLNGFGRAAFLIRWWPAIIEKTKLCSKGDRWRLPLNWTQIDHTKLEPLKDPRVATLNTVRETATNTTGLEQEGFVLERPSNQSTKASKA